MFEKEKKTYGAPEIEKIPLSDEDMNKVSGGVEPDGTTNEDDLPPEPDYTEDGGSIGNADVGKGRGRGGGCDSVPYYRPPRSFSSGRNSGC